MLSCRAMTYLTVGILYYYCIGMGKENVDDSGKKFNPAPGTQSS